MTITKPPPLPELIYGPDPLFFEWLIVISDRNGKEQRFSINQAQQILYDSLTGRDLVIKAGQLGITTFFAARGYKKVITTPNTTAILIAHEEFLTTRLLNRVQFMHDKLPLPARLKPQMGHSSSFEKSFPSINSVFYIGSAGSKVLGRGEPIQYAQLSEYAFWDDNSPGACDRITIPLMDRVPPDGEIIIESTPNGEGTPRKPNAFHDKVQEALSDPDSVWKLHELPWWLEDSYKLKIDSPRTLLSDKGYLSLNEEEISLAKRVGWSEEEAQLRIRWRRWKIKEKKSAFWQEMLEDIASCFTTVKEPFYDFDTLDRLLKGCYEPDSHNIDGAKIWFTPAPAEHNPVYSITVDPGQGKATRSVAKVWRHDLDNFSRIRQEASLSGFFDPTSFAPMIVRLGEYYYNARMAVEANGHGAACCNKITNYPNLYYRTDIIGGTESKQIGWYTTGAARIGAHGTKIFALTELQSILPQIETYDQDLIRELRQVKYSGDSIEFLSSDDHHDAAMIMAATRHSLTNLGTAGFVGESGWRW